MIRSNLTSVIGQWQAQHNRRLPLRELAELTGLSKDFLYRFQNDQVQLLDLEKLQVLCNFFQVTPDALLWTEDGDNGGKNLPASRN